MSQEQNQGGEDKKVVKAFEGNLRKLIAVIGGPQNLATSKVPSDGLGAVINELFKEEREALAKDLKEGVRNLLKAKVEMERAFKQKEQEFAKLKVEKYKEFNKAASTIFNKIAGMADVEKNYYTALGDAAAATEEPPTEENPEENPES